MYRIAQNLQCSIKTTGMLNIDNESEKKKNGVDARSKIQELLTQ